VTGSPRPPFAAAILAATLATTASAAAANYAPWRIWNDPLALSLPRLDHLVVERSSASPDDCDYGPDGHLAGSADAQACRYDHLWESRGRARYLRVEGDERVLLDERGPGALVRLWMTTGDGVSADFPPGARVRLRLDGDPVPYLDAELAGLFGGTVPPFTWPLVGDRSTGVGAAFSYVPIVFHSRLEASIVWPDPLPPSADLPLWYQFNVHRLASPASVPTGIDVDAHDLSEFAARAAGTYPWPRTLQWQSTRLAVSDDPVVLLERDRADTLLALRLQPTPGTDWNELELELDFDGETRARMSLAEFFATDGLEESTPRSLAWGVDASGRGYVFLAMPFHRGAAVRMRRTAGSGHVEVEVEHAFAGTPPPDDAMRLTARAHEVCEAGSRLAPDLGLLALSGRGRWIGLYSHQHNLVGSDGIGGPANYLEGDERVYVDGSRTPRWQGTGNEDFYNGGFYFDRGGAYGFAHAFPFTGAPLHEFAGATLKASRMYRLMLTESLPFQRGLEVRLERGAYGDQPMCARGVAFAYHEVEPALAPLSELDLDDPGSITAADYVPPAASVCESLSAFFGDEPPTRLDGRVCRFAGDASTFRFALDRPVERLWLRRRFDGRDGGQAGTIEVDGEPVARFPPSLPQPDRRWQEIEVPLDLPPQPTGAILSFRIVPDDAAEAFTEAAYLLLGGGDDDVFADGFESAP
jgi:hypothetical protein